MPFDWLNDFHRDMEKAPNYAEKTLAAYKLGMKAKGSIVGVRIDIDAEGCAACKALDPASVYDPDDAPRVPLPGCDKGPRCRCVYRPVMTYEAEGGGDPA
jgi:hypothetical protein